MDKSRKRYMCSFTENCYRGCCLEAAAVQRARLFGKGKRSKASQKFSLEKYGISGRYHVISLREKLFVTTSDSCFLRKRTRLHRFLHHVAHKRPIDPRNCPGGGYSDVNNATKTGGPRSCPESFRTEKNEASPKESLESIDSMTKTNNKNGNTSGASRKPLKPHHIQKFVDSLVFFDDIFRNDPLCEAAVDLVQSLSVELSREKNSSILESEEEDEELEQDNNEEIFDAEDLVNALADMTDPNTKRERNYFTKNSALKQERNFTFLPLAYLRALADFNGNWEDHFIHLVLFYTNNSFVRACLRSKGVSEKIQPCVIATATRDLCALQQLYQELGGQLFQLHSELVASDNDTMYTIPSLKDNDDKALVELMKEPSCRWTELVDELVVRYGKRGSGIFVVNSVFRCGNNANNPFIPLENFDAVNLDELTGLEEEKSALMKNIEFLLSGKPAHNVLLIGPRGTGKSSLVKSVAKCYFDRGLRIIQLDDALEIREFRNPCAELAKQPQKFIIFMDDIGADMTSEEIRALKSAMEGGLQGLASNMLIIATCNRRSLVFPEVARAESSYRYRGGEDINLWDSEEERLGLGERFGLILTLSPMDCKKYLQVVKHLAQCYALNANDDLLLRRAVDFAKRKNSYSGRTAKQFISQLYSEQSYLRDSMKPEKEDV
eukprot:jgi/Galph1/5792/GphlegSOOS_G4507.1